MSIKTTKILQVTPGENILISQSPLQSKFLTSINRDAILLLKNLFLFLILIFWC